MNPKENTPPWWTWQGKAEREFARIRRLYRTAEVDDYGWEAACDRMAMDIIAGDPGTAARTYHVTLYREV